MTSSIQPSVPCYDLPKPPPRRPRTIVPMRLPYLLDAVRSAVFAAISNLFPIFEPRTTSPMQIENSSTSENQQPAVQALFTGSQDRGRKRKPSDPEPVTVKNLKV